MFVNAGHNLFTFHAWMALTITITILRSLFLFFFLLKLMFYYHSQSELLIKHRKHLELTQLCTVYRI